MQDTVYNFLCADIDIFIYFCYFDNVILLFPFELKSSLSIIHAQEVEK